MSRYLVGIDLGTTHTVVAFADSEAPAGQPMVFPIPQLVAPGEVAERPLLPSLRYHPAGGEISAGDRVLPWETDPSEDPVPDAILGALAQALGSRVPGRLVVSAKSWLSHPGVDRTAPILPWGAPPEVRRVSPLDASAGYLRHVRRAWDHRIPDHPLVAQDLVLTVPASFDEVARRLTVEAARIAGLPRVRLVEEPQAACYDWLARHGDTLEQALAGADPDDFRAWLGAYLSEPKEHLRLARTEPPLTTPAFRRAFEAQGLLMRQGWSRLLFCRGDGGDDLLFANGEVHRLPKAQGALLEIITDGGDLLFSEMAPWLAEPAALELLCQLYNGGHYVFAD